MTKKIFSSLATSRLSVNDAHSIIKSTIDMAIPVQDSIGEIPRATLQVMITSESALSESINKSQKSLITNQLTDINADRKNRFAEIKRTITNAIKGRDAAKKAAAESIKNFLDPFWDVTSESMNTQTGDLFNMFSKYYANPTLLQLAAEIGIDVFMNELQTVNIDFDNLYKTRNNELASKQGPSGSDIKPQAVAAYVEFCTAVEQAVNFNGNDALVSLFNNMDELRKKYALLIHDTKNGGDAPMTNTVPPTPAK